MNFFFSMSRPSSSRYTAGGTQEEGVACRSLSVGASTEEGHVACAAGGGGCAPVREQPVGMGATSAAITVFCTTSNGSL